MTETSNPLLEAALSEAAAGNRVGPLHAPILEQVCACNAEERAATPVSHGYAQVDGYHVACSCTDSVCGKDRPGKHPRTPNGKDDFTTDEATIRAWWEQWPAANLGVCADTFDTLDIDRPSGLPRGVREAMPRRSPRVDTGRGHHYRMEKQDPALAPPKKLSFGEWITDGYVVAPPSLHPSGTPYSWSRGVPGSSPGKVTQTLVKALEAARATAAKPVDDTPPERLLERALDTLGGLGSPIRETEDGQFEARCPVHTQDGQAHSSTSLSLRLTEDRLLVHCHAGCPYPELVAALRIGSAERVGEDEDAQRRDWFDAQPDEPLGQILDHVVALMRRHLVASDALFRTVALWVVFTWLADRSYYAPRLRVHSPVMRSGKTLLFDLTVGLIRHGSLTIAPSPAALYRSIEDGVVFLLDEVDNYLNAKSETADLLTAVLNAGYKRGATVPRVEKTVDGTFITQHFPVFGPVAYSGIGEVAATLADRSIPLELRRRTTKERVERFRARDYEPLAAELASRIEVWAYKNTRAFEAATENPALIGGVSDRTEEIWEPLLALADLAGGDWPGVARDDARLLHTEASAHGAGEPLQLQLLDHMREVFADAGMPDQFPADEMLHALSGGEEWPWATINRGQPVTRERVASLMRKFGVASYRPRLHVGDPGYDPTKRTRYVPRVWRRGDLEPLWERYLEPLGDGADDAGPEDAPNPDHPDHPDHPAGHDQDGSGPGRDGGPGPTQTTASTDGWSGTDPDHDTDPDHPHQAPDQAGGPSGPSGPGGPGSHHDSTSPNTGADETALLGVMDGQPMTRDAVLEAAGLSASRAGAAFDALVSSGAITKVPHGWVRTDATGEPL